MPKGTPAEVLNRAAEAIAAAVTSQAAVATFTNAGLEPFSSKPQEYAQLLQENYDRWDKKVKASGFKPEL